MAWAQRIVVGAGALTLAAALVLVLAPEALAPLVDTGEVEAAFEGRGGQVVLGLLLLSGATVAVWTGVRAPQREQGSLLARTEPVAQDGSTIQAFDRAVRQASASGDRRDRESVRLRLRSAAIETITAIERCPRATASERVLAGDWTDDPVAAAFLGDVEAPDYPLQWRLYAWLHEEKAFEESVDRSLSAIEAYEEGGEYA